MSRSVLVEVDFTVEPIEKRKGVDSYLFKVTSGSFLLMVCEGIVETKVVSV